MNGTFIVAAAPTATTAAKPSATPSPTMSMGSDTPAAAPASPAPKPDTAPRAASAAPAAPAPAPSPAARAAAPAPKAAASSPTAAAAGDNLPHTGPASSRLLLLLAGLALAGGGLSVLGGVRPARRPAPSRR
jgi:LPXTG-motif cell wall-anchored protein